MREDDGSTSPILSRITFSLARTATGARFEASAREGAFVAPHARILVRVRRVDHDPSSVKLDGVALARAASAESPPPGSYAWDANDRSIVVSLADRYPFAVDLTYDATLAVEGDVPLRVSVPAGTPTTTAIHVASARGGWVHTALTRTGDQGVGTPRIPRGGYTSFRNSRGSRSTGKNNPDKATIG